MVILLFLQVVRQGLTPSEYLANADNGKYMKLSNSQLAQLEANPEFNKNYSILPGDMWVIL